MNRRMIDGLAALALATGLWLAGLTPLPAAAAQPMGPEAVVRALNSASNARDATTMRALIAPDAHFVQDPGAPGARDQSREEFIAGVTAPDSNSSSISNLVVAAPDTVTFDITLTGGNLPKLAHPLLLHATVRVVGGRVTNAVFVTSAQSRADFAALGPPPGMPATGAADHIAWAALAAAMLLCAAGALVRRARRAMC